VTEAPITTSNTSPVVPPMVPVPHKSDHHCPDAEINIVFVIDGSGSIGPKRFELMKNWVIEVANDFNIGDQQTRIGVVHYNKKALIEFGLQRHQTNIEVTEAISKISHKGGKTYTGNALLEAQALLQFDNSQRKKVLILLTGTSPNNLEN